MTLNRKSNNPGFHSTNTITINNVNSKIIEFNEGDLSKKRKRKQVKIACTNCRKSKTACSNNRPCNRCITHNLSNCQDFEQQKVMRYDSGYFFFFFLFI